MVHNRNCARVSWFSYARRERCRPWGKRPHRVLFSSAGLCVEGVILVCTYAFQILFNVVEFFFAFRELFIKRGKQFFQLVVFFFFMHGRWPLSVINVPVQYIKEYFRGQKTSQRPGV